MALFRYRSVARGRRLPRYVSSHRRRIDCPHSKQLSTGELWSIHDSLLTGVSGRCSGAGPSLLDIKAELADRMLQDCHFCERHCGVNRKAAIGFCGVTDQSSYFFEQTLWGEEPPLVPSHEVFFSGCNLHCKFCYSWESLLDPTRGKAVDPEAFANLISSRRKEGAANLNLIGGEPTVHLAAILSALRLVDEPTAVVWNSNFYMSEQTMRLLDGVVDLYLGDFRFGSEACARNIGGVERYVETAARNFLTAAKAGDLIIRHLVLPGHVDCCLRPIADWVATNLPKVPFNLMFQYTPFFEALDDPGLCRSLTPDEERQAVDIARSHGLNTTGWKRPLRRAQACEGVGKGALETTITIRPDGRVGIMHLHGELLQIVGSLAQGETSNG